MTKILTQISLVIQDKEVCRLQSTGYRMLNTRGATKKQSHNSENKTIGAPRSQSRTSKIKTKEQRGHKFLPGKTKLRSHKVEPVKYKLEELRGHKVV